MKNQSWLNRWLLCWMLTGVFFHFLQMQNAIGQSADSATLGRPQAFRTEKIQELLDPFFADRMAKGNIPDAVFVLVKDGQMLFAKGYGYADLERKKPMNPERTIFRAGSICLF